METEMKDMSMEMVKATYNKMKEMMAKEMSHEQTEEDKEKEALQKEAVGFDRGKVKLSIKQAAV